MPDIIERHPVAATVGVVIVVTCYLLAVGLCRASADADARLAAEQARRDQESLKPPVELTDEQADALWRAMHDTDPPRRRYYR